MSGYPRKNERGETVWACCESSIGPVCEHRRRECTTLHGRGLCCGVSCAVSDFCRRTD